VHRPPQTIVDECKRLADAGVIEVTLLGQTVNHYRFEHGAAVSVGGVVQPQKGRTYVIKDGVYVDPYKDAGGNGASDGAARITTFADLLAMIHEQVPAIQRLRFVTSFPRSFGDDVLRVIRDHPRICRYLHVPAQSGSNRILRLMNRGYTVEEYLDFLDRARAHLHQPEIGRPLTVAGDIIVGFPTETDEDFAATVELLKKALYKNCFIFKYSPRPGTIAIDKFQDDVPDGVKRRRNNQLLDLQTTISEEVGREFVGMTLPVMVEGVSRREQRKSEAPPRERGQGVGDAALHGHAHGAAGVALTIGGKSMGGDVQDHECGSACATEGSHVLTAEAEEPAIAGTTVQMSARTEGDLIVFFDQPPERAAELAGSIVRVRITQSQSLALLGELRE
jgi:tRNA-2-methylthio-N6-dimethylallyladenosine synthase